MDIKIGDILYRKTNNNEITYYKILSITGMEKNHFSNSFNSPLQKMVEVSVKFDFEKLVKRELAKIFANFLPSFVVDANIDINLLSHDKSVIEDYKNDPLNHGKISFQMANHLFHLSYAIYEKAKLLQIPILMIHGDADGIAEARGSIELDSHITSNKKTLKIYPGLYHELMNELPESREIVLNDIKKFLDSVVPEKL